MRRLAESELINWSVQIPRMPLLLRGARQVGKTTLVRLFAQHQHFDFLEINFELMPKFKACFESLEPADILVAISFLSQKKIEPGKTLLFLDEIQICPQAILALRYFKEKMPDLHVIAAGSLLEFTLNQPDFRMPVGRIQSLYLKPLSFYEYLMARQSVENMDYLSALNYQDKIPEAIHEQLLEAVKEYMIVGGMPEVVKYHLETRDYLMTAKLQGTILDNYRNDFGKYGIRLNLHLLQSVFERLPGLSGQHFKFSKLNLDAQSREIKPVLQALHDAGLAYSVRATHASGFPLSLGQSDKRFKLLFLDLGLMQHAQGLSPELLLGKAETLLHRGMLAEQFVGQELLVYQPNYEPASLFYWERDKLGSQAEVDYVIQCGGSIIPIEVKAGSTGRLKSLHVFMEEKSSRIGLHVSSSTLSCNGKILSIPLYLTWRLPELAAQMAERQ